jgi:hypothetical protein
MRNTPSNAARDLENASIANFDAIATGELVTGNAGNGVNINDLSFASFGTGDNVSGNSGQPDVMCNPQFSATRRALTGIGSGTTNCVEPAGSPREATGKRSDY